MRPLLLWLGGCAPHLPVPPPHLERPLPRFHRSELPDVVLRSAHVATNKMSDHLGVAGGAHTDERSPVTVYVLQHPVHGTVLIDSGFPRRTAVDTDDLPGRLTTRLLELQMGTPMADLLPDIGVQADEVSAIVLTHVHHDHAAGVEDFPNAILYVDRDEWLWGQRERKLHGVIPEPYLGRTARFPTWSHGRWGPFDAHTDLFADGSVLLFPTPGHTPGSMLVLVNTREHSWLFTGDVAWIDAAWQDPRPKGWPVRTVVEVDWRSNMAGLHQIKALAAHPEITVISGHEPDNLTRLPAWPEPWKGGLP